MHSHQQVALPNRPLRRTRQRSEQGAPGYLVRGQQLLGQNYFPGLVSKPVPENKNVSFCCDAFERGNRRRPWSVVTRVHQVAATAEAWPWVERVDDVGDDKDKGEDEGEDDVPDACPFPRRPGSSGRDGGDMEDDMDEYMEEQR